jgi:hypothetical protein
MGENALLYTHLGGDPKRDAHAKCEGVHLDEGKWRRRKGELPPLPMPNVYHICHIATTWVSPDLGGGSPLEMRHLKGEVRTSF